MSLEGFTVWFTGITGSGKSTLARMLGEQIAVLGKRCEVLDSGRIRQALNRSLGYTREEIEQALLRIGYECKLLNRNGIVAIAAAVSPYRDVRDRIRQDVDRFVEVFCRCPTDVLLDRDDKGLLSRARAGEIQHVAGINAPYEEPLHPEVVCKTDVESPDACLNRILRKLQEMDYLPKSTLAAYSAAEEEIIKQRFQDLGYM